MPQIRTGANNGGTDKKELFLKQYGGEVMASFNAVNQMEKFHKVKNIGAGKSFQFPVIGRASATYFTPGTELTGQNIAASERVIDLDDVLLHDVYIPEVDELMDHVSKRQEYSRQQGESLANTFDKNVLRQMILAARASATITGQEGGTVITNATAASNAASLAGSIFAAAQSLDEKFVPDKNDRFAFIKPAQYYLLAQNTALINKDWGGEGSYAEGSIVKIGNIGLIKTNNLPTTNESADTSVFTKYRGNYSTTVAVIANPEAVGTVKRTGIMTEADYKTEWQATHLVSKMLVGHGILRPEAAVEIKTA